MGLRILLYALPTLLPLAIHEHARQRDNINAHDGPACHRLAQKGGDGTQHHKHDGDDETRPESPPGSLAPAIDSRLLKMVPVPLLALSHRDDSIGGAWKYLLVATEKVRRRVRASLPSRKGCGER